MYPLEDLDRIRHQMFNSFMEPFPVRQIGMLPSPGWTWWPPVDIRETEGEVIVSAELPGIDPKDLDITVNEDSLILRGETTAAQERTDRGYRLRERRYGSFHRSIPFPSQVKPEEAKADYRDGVLEITIPKEDVNKRRGIKLNVDRLH
jgi:HSP20 family protein